MSGTISKKELEYDGARASIPASNIPKGKSGLVHIWGRNDTSEAQRLGIFWRVRDPDNVIREEYSTWEAWPYTGAGKEHEFIGGRFPIDKAGTWTITVGLYIYPEGSVAVDSYYGTLCVVPTPSWKLKTNITPLGAGYVETTPNPQGGYQKWVNNSTGQFQDGARVSVKATPYAGYRFDHWSTDILGGVSYQNPEYVQDMTQDRVVTCHFREEEEPDTKELEVDIVGGQGHVLTEPASLEGKTTWYGGDTGTFPRGTNVKVTAVPNTGYVFNHWSDEIVGGVNYDNPAYVQPMTEHRAVKCHFRAEEEPDVETLEVDIVGGQGHVVTEPASLEGKTTWQAGETGTFPYGTSVKVTAHPEAGYVFEKWSDEIIGGVSYSNPSYVQDMTEHRAVKCHFRAEEEPTLETLEVDITPIGKGYVETDPDPEAGYQKWANESTGQFPYGTKVKVTAYPYAGYRFEKWSDEIVGGVSYQNPEYVQDMTKHRSVKAHFREGDEEPVTGKGELTAIVIHWQEYTNLIPPAEIEARGSYEIHPVAKNIGTEATQFRIVATVTKPSGVEVVKTDIDGWPYTSEGTEFKPTLNMGDVDEVGTWTAVISLYDHKTDELLDSWSGDLLIVTAAEAGITGIMGMIGPILVIGLMAAMVGMVAPKMEEGVA